MYTRAPAVALCIALFTTSASAQTVWYVDDDGDAENGCTSWEDACPELQMALSLASDGLQFEVDAGTYKPAADVATGNLTFNFNKAYSFLAADAWAGETRSAQTGQCTVFSNQAEFEAFNEQDKLLKGIEDFEESILPLATVDGMDDPLCGGVPNLPDGFPYPNGLEELNICVQSNNLGGAAVVPSPTGLNGLATASAGFLGAVSDAVVANYFVDSLDLMFSGPPVPPDQEDNHTGVGFNTLDFLGIFFVQIQVFDKNNVMMVSTGSFADEAGNNFFGVWCPETIGRINIFDWNGAEGGDNIQMWVENTECQSGDKCDDGIPCTDDLCDPDDPNADEFGCTHAPANCADGNPCTDDDCDPDTGCTHEDIECSEGQVCEPVTGECVEGDDPCECVNGRVTLCHIPPGNLANASTITVGCAARDKHLAHGDFCGPCEDADG